MPATARKKPRKLHKERLSKRSVVEEKIKEASETPLLDQKPPAIPPFDGGPLVLPVKEYAIQPLPRIGGAKRASAYLRVTDIPDLSKFQEVNPRSPDPNSLLIREIKDTLIRRPLQMELINRGLFLLVEKIQAGDNLIIDLTDPDKHGLIDGGHTYTAIRQLLETGTEEEKHQASKASVPIHIFSGVPHDIAVEMAAGLNTSKQVKRASLDNLRGYYDVIRDAVKGTPAEGQIAYEEGEKKKAWKIGEILGYAEMFNFERYSLSDNPYNLYAHVGNVERTAGQDLAAKNPGIILSIQHLPEILKLADLIHKVIEPLRAKEEPEKRGKGRPRKDGKVKEKKPSITLPFIGEKVVRRLGAGWLYPILASFRANLNVDIKTGTFRWKRSNEKVLMHAATRLVKTCLAEQRAASNKPEWVGKRESAYEMCKREIDITVRELSA